VAGQDGAGNTGSVSDGLRARLFSQADEILVRRYAVCAGVAGNCAVRISGMVVLNHFARYDDIADLEAGIHTSCYPAKDD
jgi:hypothetical protein